MGTRFGNVTREQMWFVPTIASKAAPTAAEIAAGKNLGLIVRRDTVSGFMAERDQLDGDDLGSDWANRFPGTYGEVDASFDIYRSTSSSDPEEVAIALLDENTTGFIYFGTKGTTSAPVATDVGEVWPIQVRSNNVANRGANELRRNTVKVSITSKPAFEATVAAGA